MSKERQPGRSRTREIRQLWKRKLLLRFWHDPEFEEERRERVRKIIEKNKERAVIRPKVLPLARRRVPVEEIVMITGFDREQVHNAVTKMKLEPDYVVPRSSRQEISEAHRKKAPYSSERLHACALVSRFLEMGILTGDLTFWQELQEFYQTSQRPLPEDFADRARLEVFLRARREAEDGNRTLLTTYIDLGEGVDKEWFGSTLTNEQRFITDMVHNQKIGGRNGEIVVFQSPFNDGARYVRAASFFKGAGADWS